MTVHSAPAPRWRGQRDVDGRRLWTCDTCLTTSTWAPGWAWLGRYRIGRYSETEVIERVVCADCARREGVKPL